MRAVIQRVKTALVEASIEAPGGKRSKIGPGFLVLLGVETGDTEAEAGWLAVKIAGLRVFDDDAGKMNRALADIGGAALVVSQFTLLGDCSRGRRPGFDRAAKGEEAERLYERFCSGLQEAGVPVETGFFGERMRVALVNDGPVTLILERRPPTDSG